MKLINKMLIAVGLLTLSSVGFASSVTDPGFTTPLGDAVSTGAAGSIVLDNTSPAIIFEGVGASGSIFYDLRSTFDTNTFTVSTSTNAVLNPTDQDIWVNIFKDGGDGVFDALVDIEIGSALGSLSAFLLASIGGLQNLYFIEFVTTPSSGVSASISAVPVPAAGILFASALFGAGFLGRRKKKAAKANMIGAFARTA